MEVPEDFPFPFKPYPIQADFMKNLYLCLENGLLGIFESPTGTGKTLSIICGSLKWLLDHQEKQKSCLVKKEVELNNKIKEIEANNGSDWFSMQTEKIELNLEKQVIQKKLNILLKCEEKNIKYKQCIKEHQEKNKNDQKSLNTKWKNSKMSEKKESHIKEDDDECIDKNFILNEIDCCSDTSEEEENEEEIAEQCKIFFCSRTHSQLSQFIGELKKSPYSEKVSLVSLASRNNYCINAKIKSLKNINMINEQCQLLQKKKSTSKKEKPIKRQKVSTSCPFLPGNQSLLMAEILTSICDIEEIVKKSEELKTCPYYATRKSVEDGQVILVPYNSILHKRTRMNSGINLKGNILIIDEAHNLLDAIERMHSVSVTGKSLLHCFNQLSQYKKRFENVLTAKNVLFLSQLSFCIKKLIKILGGNAKSHPDEKIKNTINKLYTIEDFETVAEIDTINVFDLINFIQKSNLIHKLHGYVEKYQNIPIVNDTVEKQRGVTAFLNSFKKLDNSKIEDNHNESLKKSETEHITNPLTIIMSFLESLKTNCVDGRIFVVSESTIGEGCLKFLLLNPAAHFSDIVQEARAVILAGGTMEPMSEFKEQLFISAGATPERIVTFSCDHVIPKENILTCILKSGPTGQEFEFNYQHRENSEMLNELGRTLVNLCNIIPAGIVVFLPSYKYEDLLFKHLQSSGILTKISRKKCIFREPKLSNQVNEILEKYSCSVKNPVEFQNGAILFSVVGGKLSEGLNFSDDLGRCIVVVGMPYPNIKSSELQEKIKYLNENVNPKAGNIFYENSCIKAVNQCIGRAVRHVADYSTVLLLDKRYSQKIDALPNWIQRTVAVHTKFNTAIQALARFFVAKNKLKT
ncbi:PREDICTED: probable ATP-dependent RNA helicase DDX11 [Ceratosolen solmsi marchali]|uniref:DNA 5'-3' helicase n=1 Tax=Ceratosolen solmsi marchali TaxID=326594 RepID=A0AAJ7E239_9HYME|nr:PREDICTED: probable ATP-dependent RNA helicase DDX11 [Ceratosolen solmsi marchali]